jgi:hypothetical protein
MFNKSLIEHIRNSYSELNSLRISISGDEVKGTLYNLLTPFLAFTNTLDNYNRIISFYNQEGSKQQKLLPFYIGISNYYKVFHDIQSGYDPSKVDTSELNRRLIEVQRKFPQRISYLNKKWKVKGLNVKLSRGNKIYFTIESIERRPIVIAPAINDLWVTFNRMEDVSAPMIKSEIDELQIYLDEFLRLNKKYIIFENFNQKIKGSIDIKDIVKLGSKASIEPKAGVLLFTNKTKYKKLISDVKVNDSEISKLFPIAEVKVDRNSEFKVHQQGNKKRKPIIYYASSDYYMGWETIINELDLSHVNTLVFDDFDIILKKEARQDFNYFSTFAEELLENQRSNRIKDIYFLKKDFSFDLDQVLKDFNIDSYPWLLNHIERNYLANSMFSTNVHFELIPVNDSFSNSFWHSFKLIARQLSEEIRKSTNIKDKADFLSAIKFGYDFFDSVNSFCQPTSGRENFNKLISELETITNTVHSISFSKQVNKLKNLKGEMHHSWYKKLNVVAEALSNTCELSYVLIVSKNRSHKDINDAERYLKRKGSEIEYSFIHIDEIDLQGTRQYDFIFFFCLTGKLAKSILLTRYSKRQFLVLNSKMEFGFFKYCFNKYTPIIENLSNFDNKLLLLNLEDQEYLIKQAQHSFDISDYINYQYLKDSKEEIEESINEDGISEEVLDDSLGGNEFEFSFTINRIIQDESKKDVSSTKYSNNEYIMLYFDDSFIRVSSTKYFYLLFEDEEQSESEIKKQAQYLKEGDKVFLMSGFNNDFNELLKYLRKKYDIIDRNIDSADSWRQDLRNKHEELGGVVNATRRYLVANGIRITSPTVDRWLSGLTIYPDSLPQLIELFQHDTNSISSRYHISDILESTQWIAKFRTKLHKEIYLYHIYKTYDMVHQITELELKSIIESLNEVVEVKEILMIQAE